MRVWPQLAEIGFFCWVAGLIVRGAQTSEKSSRVWASGQNVSPEGMVPACPAGRSLRSRSRIHWRSNINNPAVSETKLKDEG